MSQTYLFLDFDETLFNHYSFLEWLDDYLAKNYRSARGAFKAAINDFHEVKGENMRLYRHADHLEAVVQQRWSFLSGEIERAYNKLDHDFCYPEVHETLRQLMKLDHDVRILTYGDGAYQRFKLNTCSLLHELRIPVHVVDEAKRLFLLQHFPTGKGILVDDKHPLHLPDNWQHIWLDRKGEPEKALYQNEVRITSFDQVPHALAGQ